MLNSYEVSLLEKKGFEQYSSGCYMKLLNKEELKKYFDLDADILSAIDKGDVSYGVLDVDVNNKEIVYSLFEVKPTDQEIANANVWEPDDYDGGIEGIENL